MLENYSSLIQKLLTRKKINIGNRVSIKKRKLLYEGLLMPRIDL